MTEERLQELQAQYRACSEKAFQEVSAYEENSPELFERRDGFAIVPVHGTLGKHLNWIDRLFGGVNYDDLAEALSAAEADPETGAIILDVRSPGGMVIGLPECAARIAALRKDTICYTDYACCSAAYWLGSQCDAIYSAGSAVVGSIGILAAYTDVSKALEREGIRVNAFASGKWKLAGSPFKPMTEEEKAMFQARVDKAFRQFSAAVNVKRSISDEAMQGQVFDGEEAIEAGLSDGIYASLDELIEDLAS